MRRERLDIENWKNPKRIAALKRYPGIRFVFSSHDGMLNDIQMVRILDTLINVDILHPTSEPSHLNDRLMADLFNRFIQDWEFFTHCYSLMDLAVKSNCQHDLFDYLHEHALLQSDDQHFLYLILLELDNQSLLTPEVFDNSFYALVYFFRELLQDICYAFAGKPLSAFVSTIQFFDNTELMNFFSDALEIYKAMGLFSSNEVVGYFEKLNSILAINDVNAIHQALLQWKAQIEAVKRVISSGLSVVDLGTYLLSMTAEKRNAILGKMNESSSFILTKLISNDYSETIKKEEFCIFFTEENLVQLSLLCDYAIKLNILQNKKFETLYLKVLIHLIKNPNTASIALNAFCKKIEDFGLFFPEYNSDNSKAKFLVENRDAVYNCCMHIGISIYDLINEDLVSVENCCLLDLTEGGAKFLGYMNRYNISLIAELYPINFFEMLWMLSAEEIETINNIGGQLSDITQGDEEDAESRAVNIFNIHFSLLSSDKSSVFFNRCLKELAIQVNQLNTPTSSVSFFQESFVATTARANSDVQTSPRSPVSPVTSA